MESTFSTPILLLLFNRPQHTQEVMQLLQELRPARLYLHCDGPRPHVPGEVERVAEVRKTTQSISWPCEVKTLFREENAGLRAGVYGALNWFFSEEESGIVLEDDCAPDLSFFPFCESLLKKYAEDETILHIGGFNIAEADTRNMSDSYFFSRLSFVWGWASWRRAWHEMSIDLDGFENFVAEGSISELLPDPIARAYMLEKFRATKARENNSWAYAWSFSIMKNKGLSIVPRVNLVQNTGIGALEATHTTKADERAGIKASAISFPLQHPKSKTPPKGLDQRIFYHSQKSRPRLLLWFLLKKLGLR